jgi:CheY-like chemotaxis protein
MNETPVTIALLDDDAAVQELFIDILTDEGYRVVCYPDGANLCAGLVLTQPALILLDVHLGGGAAGWTTLEALRRDPFTAAIPVILTSADVVFLRKNASAIQQLRAAVQEKPFLIDELVTNVARAIGYECAVGA